MVRLAKVRRRAAVLVLAEEASEEVGAARVEVEPLPVVTPSTGVAASVSP